MISQWCGSPLSVVSMRGIEWPTSLVSILLLCSHAMTHWFLLVFFSWDWLAEGKLFSLSFPSSMVLIVILDLRLVSMPPTESVGASTFRVPADKLGQREHDGERSAWRRSPCAVSFSHTKHACPKL